MAFQAPFMTTTRSARPPPRYNTPTRVLHGAPWSPEQSHRRIATDVSHHLYVEIPPSYFKCEGHVHRPRKQAVAPFRAEVDEQEGARRRSPIQTYASTSQDEVEELALRAALTTDLKERQRLLKLLDGRPRRVR
mmetsp:Transcript_66245/g.123687  ORF Transcript_66245/g.123687 Transcript_66245/m.123687 type:complete len:134 (-) Transcript_66245:61-462(-)